MPFWDNAVFAHYAIPTWDGVGCLLRLIGNFEQPDQTDAIIRGVSRSVRVTKTQEWLGKPGGVWRNGWYEDGSGQRFYSDFQSTNLQDPLGILARQFDALTGLEHDCKTRHAPQACFSFPAKEWWGSHFSVTETVSWYNSVAISNGTRYGLFIYEALQIRVVESKYTLETFISNISLGLMLLRWLVCILALLNSYRLGVADWHNAGIGSLSCARSFNVLPLVLLPRLKFTLAAFWTVGCEFEGQQKALSEAWFAIYPGIAEFMLFFYSLLNFTAKVLHRRVSDKLFGPTLLFFCLMHRFRMELAQSGWFEFDGRISTVILSSQVDALRLTDFFTTDAALRMNGNIRSMFYTKLVVLALNVLPLVLFSDSMTTRGYWYRSFAVGDVEKALAPSSAACPDDLVTDHVLINYEVIRLGYIVFGGKYLISIDDWYVVTALAPLRLLEKLWNHRIMAFTITRCGTSFRISRTARLMRLDDPELLSIPWFDVVVVVVPVLLSGMVRGLTSSRSTGRASTSHNPISQLTSSILGSLQGRKQSKSTRSVKSKHAKVFADNRSSRSRKSRRTSGRQDDSENDAATDLAEARLQNRTGSFLDADAALTMLKRESTGHEFDYVDDAVDRAGSDEDDSDGASPSTVQRRRGLAVEMQDEMSYFSQRGGDVSFKVGHRHVIHPHGRTRAVWDVLLVLIISWILVTTPIELCFAELSARTRRAILRVDYVLDAIFLLDIVLNFMTAVEFDGKLHFSTRSIIRHYVGSWFCFDAVLTFPFYAFTSCTFAYLAFGDQEDVERALADQSLQDDSLLTKYIAASYWSMMTIATVGYGDLTVKSNTGRLFSIVAMVTGGGIFAYGISNVVDLFQQLYLDEAEHRHKMDLVNAFMHERSLPRKLRDEIRANFFHLRKATRENKVQDRAIVKLMSRTMQARVADLFCLDMMPHRLPSLAGCNAEFIHELYLVMDVKCYLPGEDIIRQDDYGTEMYFLFVGHVQVFIGHTKVAMFGPNSCFGEFAILNPRKARLATIQAMDFCETHCVEREELLKVLIRHPFMLHSIRQLVQPG
ncbi:hypothetical protein ATCC90586_008296 [Pythium insidiosum]|nr:hypothetical protein ATCC90586_008296 [Pythium insidiosum]